MVENIKKNILVTGAGGFLGYHLSNYLVELGHSVDGVDLHFPTDPNIIVKPRFNPIEADFREEEPIKKALTGKEVVFHLASAHLQISLDEAEYWDINVHSLKNFLELARASGVKRFIHTSSVGLYGNLKSWPADEKSPCYPQSIYGETKLAGEKEVVNYCRENQFAYVILRPAWVFGQGCPRTIKLYRMLKKKRFVMIGRGANMRHPIYIKDMLEAFGLSMEKAQAVGETLLIGGEQIITTRELVHTFSQVLDIPGPIISIPYPIGLVLAKLSETLFGLIGKEPPISTRTLEFFNTNNGFDISKAKRLLNFKPRYSVADGLRDAREWLERL